MKAGISSRHGVHHVAQKLTTSTLPPHCASGCGLSSNPMSVAAKTICPISRGEFKTHAKPVTVKINESPFVAEPREFSTGSLGWNINGKMTIEIGGKMVSVQIGMNLTIVGSKELPKEAT